MIPRFLEIADDGRHLSVDRGFLVVSADRAEIGRVPLDDIGALIANAHGLTYSNNVLLELTRRGTPVVLCGPHHRPEAFLWPIDGHHTQALRMRLQIGTSLPLKKRLWQRVVLAKIQMQAAILDAYGKPSGALVALAESIRSGDPDNVEAQAARRYWPLLMGTDFRRDPDLPGINSLLNYGYTIVRAATARALLAAGFHPSLGLHHHNRGNPMCLVDDMMEPFRPLVDLLVVRLRDDRGVTSLDRDSKRALVAVTTLDMATTAGTTPLANCLERLAQSLAASLEAGKAALDLPLIPSPLDLSGLGR
ncbi:CRISPR-associated endonuclease Cas1 [Candidatus Terasakiella magnetica]|nr:CRISPR-associated endonuclease Cas1 [Candidatus Terasakiella magnetica]